MYAVALGKISEYAVMTFQPIRESHDQKHVFQKGVLVRMVT